MPSHLRTEVTRNCCGALLSAGASLVGLAIFWGFTVDDALITARVAHHLATGQGYRFNPTGPIVDAVTPFGWAHLLAVFGADGTVQTFHAARVLGAVAWIASAGWLGLHVTRTKGRLWPLAMLGWLAPVGMWASSGMETGLVLALVTFSLGRGLAAQLALSSAAAWRPELIPFATCLVLLRARGARQQVGALAVVLGAPCLVALVRCRLFGIPYPLSAVAKPSDLTHGIWYALEAACWCGPLWLWLAPGWPFRSLPATPGELAVTELGEGSLWQRLSRRLPGVPFVDRDVLAVALATFVHCGAVALAGGDWMPGYRLLVPVMPAMLFVAGHVPRQSRLLTGLGITLALLTSIHLAMKLGPPARHIVEQRARLTDAAAKVLRSASVVATPDVGWVGAAFPGSIVDLAGVTDPAVAYLRGGHTSKLVESRLLIVRRVDHIIVLLAKGAPVDEPWIDSRFARPIDRRAAFLGSELGCAPSATLALPFTEQSYLVLDCPAARASEPASADTAPASIRKVLP